MFRRAVAQRLLMRSVVAPARRAGTSRRYAAGGGTNWNWDCSPCGDSTMNGKRSYATTGSEEITKEEWEEKQRREELLKAVIPSIPASGQRIEIPTLSRALTDETLETLEEYQGLAMFLKLFPAKFLVQSNGAGVLTVSLLAGPVDISRYGKALEVIQRHVSDNHWHPTIELYNFLSLPDKAAIKTEYKSLVGFLSAVPQLVKLSEDKINVAAVSCDEPAPHQGFLAQPPASPHAASPPPGAGGAQQAAVSSPAAPGGSKPLLHNSQLELIQPFLPSGFFVPFVELHAKIPKHIHDRLEKPLLDTIQDMTAEEVDLRILGEGLEDYYVRLVGDGVAYSSIEDGDKIFARYEAPRELALDLYDALKNQDGGSAVTIDALPSVLSAELYGRLPLRGASAILVFDRLPQYFAVDIERYEVTPRQNIGFDDDTCQPLEFNLQSSPCPRVVRYLLAMMREPLPIDQIEQSLSLSVWKDVERTFGSLSPLVAAHRLYLYLRDENVLWTCLLSRKALEERQFEGNYQEGKAVDVKAIVQEIYDALPPDRGVGYRTLSSRLSRDAYFTVGHDPRIFFEQYPDYFSVYDIVAQNKFIIQRREVPRPYNAHSPCRNISDCIKQLAGATLDGQQESTIFNRISRDARQMIKKLGGLDVTVSYFPHWFLFTPGPVRGQGFVRYIGHLSTEEKRALGAEVDDS